MRLTDDDPGVAFITVVVSSSRQAPTRCVPVLTTPPRTTPQRRALCREWVRWGGTTPVGGGSLAAMAAAHSATA
jgi:hypothetical protein